VILYYSLSTNMKFMYLNLTQI